MRFKIIKQLDNSVTVEFYNSKNEKLDYKILNIEKDGLGYIYDITGLKLSKIKNKKG